uniref:Metalloendopeptidase n=1 Tax=Strongyloides stercoralis TaxID=6248 RepID=A0AAF5DNY3_STRER
GQKCNFYRFYIDFIRDNFKNNKIRIKNNTCVKFQKQQHCISNNQKSQVCALYDGDVSENHFKYLHFHQNVCFRFGTLTLKINRNKYVIIDYNNKNVKINYEIFSHPSYFNYLITYDYSALMNYASYNFASFWKLLQICLAYFLYRRLLLKNHVDYQFNYKKDKKSTGLLIYISYIKNTIVKSESYSIFVVFKS